MTDNVTTCKITKESRNSTKINLETIESEVENAEFDREISKERYISPGKRQQFINDWKLL